MGLLTHIHDKAGDESTPHLAPGRQPSTFSPFSLYPTVEDGPVSYPAPTHFSPPVTHPAPHSILLRHKVIRSGVKAGPYSFSFSKLPMTKASTCALSSLRGKKTDEGGSCLSRPVAPCLALSSWLPQLDGGIFTIKRQCCGYRAGLEKCSHNWGGGGALPWRTVSLSGKTGSRSCRLDLFNSVVRIHPAYHVGHISQCRRPPPLPIKSSCSTPKDARPSWDGPCPPDSPKRTPQVSLMMPQ